MLYTIPVKTWNKKEITSDEVKSLCQKYSLDPLAASILCRRGATQGAEIQWFLEDDARFLHNPFEFAQMEDAVDRILNAKDEGEKVLVFGDRDVDGVTATAVLYQQLERMGIDVQWRLPLGDDPYGLNMATVDEFAQNYGTLLITVDCGISNHAEVAHANELGISVIITDHHNPPENLPAADIILNPKCEDSGYPFPEISGCAVAFKLAQALRFAQSDLYKQQVCLMAIENGELTIENCGKQNAAGKEERKLVIECLKIRNLVRGKKFTLEIGEGDAFALQKNSAAFFDFLKGEQIFVWDAPFVKKSLQEIFGGGIEFNLFDIRPEVAKIIPSMAAASLEKIKGASKIARYQNATSELDAFYNIFVTYIEKKIDAAFPKNAACDEKDLQLVTLAVISDIMPLKNENRIFVKQGLSSINNGKSRQGLAQILARQSLLGKPVTATDLAWSITPVLNAAGRLGNAELSLRLFLEQDKNKIEDLASQILGLNEERKHLVDAATEFLVNRPEKSVEKFGGKFCLICEEKINKGVLGLIAAKLLHRTGVPSIAITKIGEDYVGSMRSTESLNCTDFLDKFGDIYINHGGHAAAAGFSLTPENYELFLQKIHSVVDAFDFSTAKEETLEIDAEIPQNYFPADYKKKDSIMEVVDAFEPYGNENPEIVFMTKGAKIAAAQIIGNGKHLKLTLEIGAAKWPALWWNAADKLRNPFNVGDKIDVLYNYSRNVFNGMESRQIVIVNAKIAR